MKKMSSLILMTVSILIAIGVIAQNRAKIVDVNGNLKMVAPETTKKGSTLSPMSSAYTTPNMMPAQPMPPANQAAAQQAAQQAAEQAQQAQQAAQELSQQISAQQAAQQPTTTTTTTTTTTPTETPKETQTETTIETPTPTPTTSNLNQSDIRPETGANNTQSQ